MTCITDLRQNEITESPVYSLNDLKFRFIFSTRLFASAEAKINVMMTGLVCVVLAAGGMLISQDATNLVLRPIERMIAMMNQIKRNPLVATQLGMEQDKPAEKPKGKIRRQLESLYSKLCLVFFFCKSRSTVEDPNAAPMETMIP